MLTTMSQSQSQATTRQGRSREPSSSSVSSTSAGPTMSPTTNSSSFNRSPVRSLPSVTTSTQRLRTPLGAANTINSQRRSSFATVGDLSSDFSTSLGMPYTYSVSNPNGGGQGNVSPNNGSCPSKSNNFLVPPSSGALTSATSHSTISPRTPILTTALSQSSKGSSRSSPKSGMAYLDISGSDRFSETLPRRHSTEEVFDLMEREQDAIVLKLMREIAQLKEENRALLSAMNTMQSSGNFNSVPGSKRGSISARSSIDFTSKNTSPTISHASLHSSNQFGKSSGTDSNYSHTSSSIQDLLDPQRQYYGGHHHHQHHHHHHHHGHHGPGNNNIPGANNHTRHESLSESDRKVPRISASLTRGGYNE